jgi:methylated-DNA-[protein]-cysteine S-methyltransferase
MATERFFPVSGLKRLAVLHPFVNVTLFGRLKHGRVVVAAVRFGIKKTFDGRPAANSRHPALVHYGRMVRDFLDGKGRDLSKLPLDLSGLTPFAKKALLAARRIPFGKTVSYVRLAAMAGNPRAVRAAASAMRRNPFPLVIPCHRVIRSDGSAGGFMGKTAGREVRLKRLLLEREASVS